jgi:hypothetical protein
MVQRGLFCAAAAVMVCAIGAAVLQLAVLILGMPSSVAITVITLVGRDRRGRATTVRPDRARQR